MKVISFFLLVLAGCSSHQDPLSPKEIFNRKIVQCYEESDSMAKFKKGKIKYRMNVDHQGKVTSIRVMESDFPEDPNLEACAAGILKQTPVMNDQFKGKSFEAVQEIDYSFGRKLQ